MHCRSIAALALAVVVGAMACASTTGASRVASDRSAAPVAAADAAASTGPVSSARDATTDVACPLTRPEPAFTAPSPFPATPPARYGSAWYGSSALWTMLPFEGDTWRLLPHSAHGLGQKTFWWSTNWPYPKELEPDITVVGRRLDHPGQFEAPGPGTNATADFGTAMLIGVEIPTPGCWALTAEYRGTRLSYVVLVED